MQYENPSSQYEGQTLAPPPKHASEHSSRASWREVDVLQWLQEQREMGEITKLPEEKPNLQGQPRHLD